MRNRTGWRAVVTKPDWWVRMSKAHAVAESPIWIAITSRSRAAVEIEFSLYSVKGVAEAFPGRLLLVILFLSALNGVTTIRLRR